MMNWVLLKIKLHLVDMPKVIKSKLLIKEDVIVQLKASELSIIELSKDLLIE